MSAYSNGAAKFHIEAKRRVIQRFSRLSFLPSFAEGHGCKPVDECEVGTLRSLGEGGYASEGSARRSVWRGATTVRSWGSTRAEWQFFRNGKRSPTGKPVATSTRP